MASKKIDKTDEAAVKPCQVSREQFLKEAKPLRIQIGDQVIFADLKEFSTGSFGWYTNGKMQVLVGNAAVKVQIGINVTVVNSKLAP